MRAATLLILAVLIGCGGDRTDVEQTEEGRLVLGRTEEHQAVRRGVIPGGRTLVIEGFHGDVELTAVDEPFADLEFVKIGRGDDTDAARDILEDILIDERGTDDEYRFTLRTENKSRSAVNLRGTVPLNADLRLSFESGSMSVNGLSGPLRVRTGSGLIRATGLRGNADLETHNGEIRATVEEVPSEARLRLQTANGNVSLSLPESASARVNAVTSAGAIRTERLEFDSRRLEPEGAGAEFSGTLGRGGATVTIITDNGSVLITSVPLDQGADPPPPDTLQQEPADRQFPPDTSEARERQGPDTTAVGR